MATQANKHILEQNQTVRSDIEKSSISTFIDSISTSFVVLNQKMEIVYFNNPFTQLVDGEITLGKKVGEIFQCVNEETAADGCSTGKFCHACPFFPAITSEQEKTSFEGFVRSKSIESLIVNVESQNIEIDGENFCILLVNDLSDKKRKNLLDRAFFHDLNNGLILAQGYLSQLIDQYPENKAVQKMKSVCKRFFDEIAFQKHFLSMESDDLIVCFESFDLVEFASSIMDSFKINAAAQNIELVTNTNKETQTIHSDPTLLQRVIVNMVKNAVEASVPGDTVSMEIGKKDDKLFVSVSNPLYITEDVQAKIFSKFFSTKGSGRGLGTYSIKLFTEKYLGGTANFSSTKENGTTFRIDFNS